MSPILQGSNLLRGELISQIVSRFEELPVVALLGARQVGKTTLAGMVADQFQQRGKTVHHFDLETDRAREVLKNPELALGDLRGLIILDEIQRLPRLFQSLRPLVDRVDFPAKFLLLGSASPDLVKGVSESLAGRVAFIQVPGFHGEEVAGEDYPKLWIRGGFPRSFLAKSDGSSFQWREDFIQTFLERDIPALGLKIPPPQIGRFWAMLAHRHGCLWNGQELGQSLGMSGKTMVKYRDLLAGTYMVRILSPWHANLEKRQVRSPKLYFRDSGLLHSLLGIPSMEALRRHPAIGVSFEGFAMEHIIARYGARNAYFWRTTAGAELDLLMFREGRSYGFEFKCADAPSMSRSMHIALEELGLERLFVVYPGPQSYSLGVKVDVIPVSEIGRRNLI